MKTQLKKLVKVQGLGDIETPESNPTLIHFLTPLEQAVYRNKFRPFKYDLDGIEIEIEVHTCKALFWHSKRNVAALRSLVQKSKQKILNQNTAVRQFLKMSLKKHKLPIRVYHILYQNGCQNMSDVANKGEQGLKRMRGMGKTHLTTIMNLFIDNGCGELFM